MANRDEDFGSEDMATQREIASRARMADDEKMPGHQFPPPTEQVEDVIGEHENPANEPPDDALRSKPDYRS